MKGKQEAAPLFPSNRHRRRHAHRRIKQKETSDRLLRKSKPPHPPLPAPSVSDGPPKAKTKRVIPSRRSSRVRKRRCPGSREPRGKERGCACLRAVPRESFRAKGLRGKFFWGIGTCVRASRARHSVASGRVCGMGVAARNGRGEVVMRIWSLTDWRAPCLDWRIFGQV